MGNSSVVHSADMDNDTRGWVMTIVSGIACVVGASIICVDLIVRLIPGQRDFHIQDSNVFLACSLSLSFGVMLFSALYSMLPSSLRYLTKGGIEKQEAGFIMMACFVGGFFGIQIISRLLHQFIPSHVVDCDHSHDEAPDDHHAHSRSHRNSRMSRSGLRSKPNMSLPSNGVHVPAMTDADGGAVESTPLLGTNNEGGPNGHAHHDLSPHERQSRSELPPLPTRPSIKGALSRTNTQGRRPSMAQVQQRVMSFMKDTKPNCDDLGPCFGYSDPCGRECFKHLSTRSAFSRASQIMRTNTGIFRPSSFSGVAEDGNEEDAVSPTYRLSRALSRETVHSHLDDSDCNSHAHGHAGHDHDQDSHSECCSQMSEDVEAQHHHHVPTNAFLSIGLQTVIAIALHKFPEGFITYATNHANPSLGFNVFMALFVHNIAEGFAMALPLYMALGSRLKAMLWSSLLGGLSQPLGAALAVLWFKIARRSNITIDNVAYACLFAITAGIMTSVALQLFVESLSLNHNRDLSIFFAFLGMTLLGVSNALVTE